VADTSGRHPGSISFGLTTNPQASGKPLAVLENVFLIFTYYVMPE